MTTRLPLALLTFACSCGGMGDATDPNHCRDTHCSGGEVTTSYTAVFTPLLLDVLVVIDDAVPSGPSAALLEQALREAGGYIADPRNGTRRGIDVNLALVPAAYPAGRLAPPWPPDVSCGQPSGPFLHATNLCDVGSNFAGELSDALACAARALPASGAMARPLDAVHALLDTGSGGPGFRRPEASLAVIVVSTSDDPNLATAAQVAEQHDYLTGLVAEPDANLSLGIVAPISAQGLLALADSFAGAGSLSDIASASWSAPPRAIDHHTFKEWWPVCLDGVLLDLDPSTDGVQADCVGTEMHVSPTLQTEALISRCPDDGNAAASCWTLAYDRIRCPMEEGLLLRVERPQCMPSYVVRYSLTCALRFGHF